MSAAGPVQPSFPPTNGHHSPSRPTTSNGPAGERVFAHIQDLKEDALTTGFNPRSSASQLYESAEHALQQAKAFSDFGRPDKAYVEYLRASEIAVVTLPGHPDYWDFQQDRGGSHKLQILQRTISSLDERFKNIKDIIIANNVRSGVLPTAQRAQPQQQLSGHARAGSDPATAVSGAHKVKPSPSPKPEKFHARAISQATAHFDGASQNPTDILANRFAQLRTFGQADLPPRPGSRSSTSSVHSLAMPTASDYGGHLDSSARLAKPQGPRGMPENGPGPPRPGKLPLDTELAAAMPKPPSPTYSPARNMQLTGNIAPPRHSARSLAGSNSRKSSLIPSSASATAPNGSADYFPVVAANGAAPAGQISRRKSVYSSKETRVDAQKLYDYLERFHILLIDFRSRQDFDEGHIFNQRIICVEPLLVRQGISATELADKLVLSPESEQILFSERDKFDLVVYHDEDTRSETYLTNPRSDREVKLRQLHEALYDFNHEKPLKRPPILLVGGIAAWADIVGNQALVQTNTQARVKPGRPIQRRPAPRDGPMSIQKRRLREYNPLDPDEERKWRERAKSESVPVTTAFVPTGDGEVEFEPGDDQDGLSSSEIDNFNARFPEAGSLGQPSFGTAPLQSVAPVPPPKIPQYPPAPTPSAFPPVPARPPPAAPRMSYTGVSDRAVSQNTPAPRSSSQLIPYIPPKYLAANIRIPRTGLINFGSTCYLNATLQALSATTPLSILFLDNGYQSLVRKDNWKGSRGLLPEIYSNTIRAIWKDDVSYIKPSTFFKFMGRLNSMFTDPSQQQDAQEFFSMVVDVLHEDLNGSWAGSPLRALTEKEEQIREHMPKTIVARMEWERFTHRENSFLTSLFYGQQSSRLKCPKCGITSTQYDATALLQIEIPDAREAKLQDCLRQHFSDELLDEDNQWTCPRCKAPRRAYKKLTMTRAPPCLVIGLKRFKSNPRTGDQRKIHTAVRFPLNGLDIEEFVLPRPSPREAQDIATHYPREDEAVRRDPALRPPYIYDAYAVVRHLGETTRSGHYIAAVKARDRWRYFDDINVTDFQPESLSPARALDNDQAYLIFYQRRPVDSSTMNNYNNNNRI